MKRYILILAVVLACVSVGVMAVCPVVTTDGVSHHICDVVFDGAVTFGGDVAVTGGVAVEPQVVAAAPAAPYACLAGVRGKMIYVDDTDDLAESYLCFCGVDADDSTYIWLKVDAPATNCF